jgi:hypothetical protein
MGYSEGYFEIFHQHDEASVLLGQVRKIPIHQRASFALGFLETAYSLGYKELHCIAMILGRQLRVNNISCN